MSDVVPAAASTAASALTDVSGSGARRRQSAEPRSPEKPLTVISPHQGWFDWRLRQLWRYRDLIALFVWRDFVAVYKQTMLGPAWHVIRALLSTSIFTVVFGRVAGLSTDGVPAFLFYMAGTVAWTYFANCIDNVSRTFLANSTLLGKVYFHRLVIPLSIVVSNFVAFSIQFGVLIVALIVYRLMGTVLPITGWVAALPVALIVLGGYALGFGLIVCALTTRYRDLSHLVTFGIQLVMYVSPVIYPVSAVPERYRWITMLNPLAPVIEAFRRGALGVGTVTIEQFAASAVVMLIVLTGGLMLFSHGERTFMDTV